MGFGRFVFSRRNAHTAALDPFIDTLVSFHWPHEHADVAQISLNWPSFPSRRLIACRCEVLVKARLFRTKDTFGALINWSCLWTELCEVFNKNTGPYMVLWVLRIGLSLARCSDAWLERDLGALEALTSLSSSSGRYKVDLTCFSSIRELRTWFTGQFCSSFWELSSWIEGFCFLLVPESYMLYKLCN